MAFAQLTKSTFLPIFFNVHANVGKNSPNQAEDVALVSFLLLKGKLNDPTVDQVTSRVTAGVYNPAMQAAIDAIQQRMKKGLPSIVIDGHISRAAPNAIYANHTPFLIGTLNWYVAIAFSSDWPRLDKIPGCPPTVRSMIVRELLAGH